MKVTLRPPEDVPPAPRESMTSPANQDAPEEVPPATAVVATLISQTPQCSQPDVPTNSEIKVEPLESESFENVCVPHGFQPDWTSD